MSDSRHGVSACESVSSRVTTTLCNILANQFFGPRSPRLRGNHPVSQVVTSTPSRRLRYADDVYGRGALKFDDIHTGPRRCTNILVSTWSDASITDWFSTSCALTRGPDEWCRACSR